MGEQLGTLDELPQEYRDQMAQAGVAPLWPMMRNVLPHDAPNPVTKPGFWAYKALRPLLMQATASIYLGTAILGSRIFLNHQRKCH